jgi:hypothetical protein
MSENFVSFELAKKLKEKGYPQAEKNALAMYNEDGEWYSLSPTLDDFYYDFRDFDENDCVSPTIPQVLKWLREEKNIDVEIHAEAGMLGNKVYVPFISTYTEFTLETSPDVIRYRQKKFNPAKPLSHEIILALTYFNKWEEAALDGIEYVLDNLI